MEIRECVTLDELAECVQLQREVFALPEVELSPVRHLIVTKNAGGFSLRAFDGDRLAGFVLSVPAFAGDRRAFYSHMTAVRSEYQGRGVGARLKWAQRERALTEGVDFIKWTFEPIKARNAYFNLEKLGAVVRKYHVNFYGTDYTTAAQSEKKIGLASDRLIAEWELNSEKVRTLAAGGVWNETGEPVVAISVTDDFMKLVGHDAEEALAEQLRIREEFQAAFDRRLVGRGFDRSAGYLLYQG